MVADDGDVTGVLVFRTPEVPVATARSVAKHLSRRISVACELAAEELLAAPRLKHRDQADADAFLSAVEALPPPEGRVAVALTHADIGHPIFTFFFGRARQGGRAAIVSTARLTPTFYGLPEDPETTLRRTVQEILHELGHVFGLPHCESTGCVMRFTSNVESLDTRGTDFCARCRPNVPILH